MNIINIPDPLPCLDGQIGILGRSEGEVTFIASGLNMTETPSFGATPPIRTRLVGQRGECLIFQVRPPVELTEDLERLLVSVANNLSKKLLADYMLSAKR